MHFRSRVDPAGGGAVLPGVVESKLAYGGHQFLEVGIVEHDDGGLASQFQMGALDVGGGGAQHLGTGGDAAGERDHPDERVGNQGLTGGGTPAGEQVDHSGGKEVGHGAA